MAVKNIVSGKHPLTVRVTDEDYKLLRIAAVECNESVNEMIVRIAVDAVKSGLYLKLEA